MNIKSQDLYYIDRECGYPHYPRGITLDVGGTKYPEQAVWARRVLHGWVISMHLSSPVDQVRTLVERDGKGRFLDRLCDQIQQPFKEKPEDDDTQELEPKKPDDLYLFSGRGKRLMSLLRDKPRQTLSIVLTLDKGFRVLEEPMIEEAEVINEEEISFDQFADFMNDSEFSGVLRGITGFAKVLSTDRISRHSKVNAARSEALKSVNLTFPGKRIQNLGEAVAEELSVDMNTILTEFCKELKVPIIYSNVVVANRNMFDPQRPVQFRSSSTESVELFKFFAACSVGHHGLSLLQYARFTSPLRSITGLINLTNLVMFLRGEEPLFSNNDLGRIINELNRS